MGPHNLQHLFQGADLVMRDPGDAGALPSTEGLAVVKLTSAAAETRRLGNPSKAGQLLFLGHETDGGDITLTVSGGFDEAGGTSIVFSDPGQWIAFVSMPSATGAYRWRVLGYEGVTGPATDLANLQATNLDLGASGTAGTLDIFPSTASKGKLAVSVTDQTGDTTVGLVIGAMAAARTLTLADPLASADILSGKMSAVARTATADGLTTGTIADAGLIQFVAVTSASANNIIVLPTPTPGRIVIGYVGSNGHELRTSSPTTISINGGSGSAAESAIGANMLWVAICTSATTSHGFTITAATLAALEAAAP